MTTRLVSAPVHAGRPTCQWEVTRGGTLALRLFGLLNRRDLIRVADSLLERARSPRDLVGVHFDDVEHLDYRALPEFIAALERHARRGPTIWIIGLSPYLRALFQVAGEGAAIGRMEWRGSELTPPFPERLFVDRDGTAAVEGTGRSTQGI